MIFNLEKTASPDTNSREQKLFIRVKTDSKCELAERKLISKIKHHWMHSMKTKTRNNFFFYVQHLIHKFISLMGTASGKRKEKKKVNPCVHEKQRSRSNSNRLLIIQKKFLNRNWRESQKCYIIYSLQGLFNPSLVNAPACARWKSTPLMFMRPNAPAG